LGRNNYTNKYQTAFDSVYLRTTTWSIQAGNGQGTATFDNIKVEVIPEPATIGMLGLGALITLGIRRKFMA
jgi:hypothetical protein